MTELSAEAIEALDKVLADPRTLNSDCINLYDYASRRSKQNHNDSPLNDIYFFLIENNFITSNNPYHSTNKFLVQFTNEGRRLHKAGSLRKYYQRGESFEKRILDYLEPNYEAVRNRIIQQSLEMEEKECESSLRLLEGLGYIYHENICDTGYMDNFFSGITPKGRAYLKPLSFPTSNTASQQIGTTTVLGNGNILNFANGGINQTGITLVIEARHYPKLKDLGVKEGDIQTLREIISKTANDKSLRLVEALKWLKEVIADVVYQGGTNSLPEFMDNFINLVS